MPETLLARKLVVIAREAKQSPAPGHSQGRELEIASSLRSRNDRLKGDRDEG
jgi:hypothetical protein